MTCENLITMDLTSTMFTYIVFFKVIKQQKKVLITDQMFVDNRVLGGWEMKTAG